MRATAKSDNLLYKDSDWTFDLLQRALEACEDIALNDLGLNVYRNQIEIITSEQMLDAYSSHGMPLMYRHWSFGKHFARDQNMYQKGYTGLAYEIVINSDPCIAYLMEENSMTMQTLVMAHACFGHNHFFKNN
ncbi:MAG: SpoVR family protein, partial [Aquisalinus sp.]|nr:SpoVR family protein [Aquisalinus sp.]